MSSSLTLQAPRAVLVTGGARSGKSRFAESLVIRSGLTPIYVATGEAHDAEMSKRIAVHKAGRAADGWQTVEEPLDLCGVLAREAIAGRAILVDCLTLWLSNLMMAERDVTKETGRLLALLPQLAAPVVFVSNEVGLGIVPENALARAFRDAQGRINQDVASVVGRVILVAAGQPMLLKPSQIPEISL